MQTILVEEMMVPLKDYATVSENATMYDTASLSRRAPNSTRRCTG